jgi:hypothetical protein
LDIPVENAYGHVNRISGMSSHTSIFSKQVYDNCDLSDINKEALNLCDQNYGKFVGMPLEESWDYKKERKDNE